MRIKRRVLYRQAESYVSKYPTSKHQASMLARQYLRFFNKNNAF